MGPGPFLPRGRARQDGPGHQKALHAIAILPLGETGATAFRFSPFITPSSGAEPTEPATLR
jgi:hypothetical protein